jgi:molecular chaperone GrpE
MSQEPDVRNAPDRRPPVVVRDRRRIDPSTLQPRRPAGPAAPTPHEATAGPAAPTPHEAPAGPETADLRRARTEAARLRDATAELTADLQRVKAEYDNYRKRVRRDRLAVREIAVTNVLAALLPVLDAFEGARRQGPDEGIDAVAEVLGEQLAALGMRTVGAPGEPFDPRTHEALTYTSSPGAAQAVCTEVFRHGYRVGDHLLRPAQVSVTGPPPADTARPDPRPEAP